MDDLERIVAAAIADNYSDRWRPHALADGLVESLREANVVIVGRCRDCSAYQVNGDWAWCGEDNLSSQNANAPLSPDGYCSDFEPRAKQKGDK